MAKLRESVETTVGKITRRGIVAEFKEFINRGNVVDIAVAFVMGAAFKTVVDSFAGNADSPGILGGFVGALFGGKQPDFSKKVLTVNGSDIPFGALATSAINFFFVALALFIVVKVYNRFRDKSEPEVQSVTTNDLLVEIRDELRQARESKGQ